MADPEQVGDVTRLLQACREGNAAAPGQVEPGAPELVACGSAREAKASAEHAGSEAGADAVASPLAGSALLDAVYLQLRALAQRRLAGERAGHTLTATALVHEAYVRLSSGRRTPWVSEAHYYAAAAEAMRQILLDHARSRGRAKRGGGLKRAPLSVLDLAAEADPGEILALDGHLQRLELAHPGAAAVVRLRFFAGLTIDQAAAALGQSPRQVDRLWAFARAWLFRALRDGEASDGCATGAE